MINPTFILSAFVAGILMFFAPCTFPLVPAYIGFITGATAKELSDPQKKQALRRKVLRNGAFFILGFSIIFIIFGVFAGFLGQIVTGGAKLWLGRLGGVFVILFGLMMTGALRPRFIEQNIKMKFPDSLLVGRPLSSFILGVALAFGWTPCIGPILGAVLTLALNTNTVWQGVFMMIIFSLGLAVPFLLIALGIGSVIKTVHRLNKLLNIISKIGGIFLIIIGLLLLTDSFGLLTPTAFHLFSFINYGQISNHL